jgi:hypothetical protein
MSVSTIPVSTSRFVKPYCDNRSRLTGKLSGKSYFSFFSFLLKAFVAYIIEILLRQFLMEWKLCQHAALIYLYIFIQIHYNIQSVF